MPGSVLLPAFWATVRTLKYMWWLVDIIADAR